MHEVDAILAEVNRSDFNADDAVLATVVRVRGSAYRRAGARMLLLRDGRRVGSISGGCLEGDLRRKAWWFTKNGKATLKTYDSISEEDGGREFGLGCNGIVDVMLERASSQRAQKTLEFLARCRTTGVSGVIVHSIPSCGTEFVEREFFIEGNYSDDQARDVANIGESRFVVTERVQKFYEYVKAPVDLVICGAGYDAVPLAQFGSVLGWRVTIADSRPAFVANRFLGVDRVIGFDDLQVSTQSAVVLMTHNYPIDLRLLRQLLPVGVRYLGLLGPRARTERLFSELGISSEWDSLHAPVGLDIGGDLPETIALSITAEIQAVLAGRNGGMLRHRVAPIYDAMSEFVA